MLTLSLRQKEAGRSVEDAVRCISRGDALVETWNLCRKIAVHLQSGSRLENLVERLGYLAMRDQSCQVSRGLERKSHKKTQPEQCNISVPTVLEPHFHSFEPISLLSSPESIHAPHIAITLTYEQSRSPHDISINDLTTSHEQITDPNELFIVPNPILPPTPSSLRTIHEDAIESTFERDNHNYQPPSPVVFFNPFARPSVSPQVYSPPATPAVHMDSLPPDLNAQEEEEAIASNHDPVNLTGRIKKLMDPPIALGGTSDIFYGEWQAPVPKKVAVKLLRTTNKNCIETVRRRLRREMRLWWKCRHRNIIPLYGFASDFGNMDAMISPWMKNGSAPVYIKANKCSWAERLKLLNDVTAGLKYLHHFEPPIIHGDLKPMNILISDRNDACLCDFGLARVIQSDGGPSGFTTSNFAGSVRYMAPELLNPEDEETVPLVDAASDIYALGCVGLELMTDQIPYANRTLDAQVIHDVVVSKSPPAKRSQCSSLSIVSVSHNKLWDLLKWTWNREPTQRPNIDQVGRMLVECRPQQGPLLAADISNGPHQSLAGQKRYSLAVPTSRSMATVPAKRGSGESLSKQIPPLSVLRWRAHSDRAPNLPSRSGYGVTSSR
ncbi:hypothetical protein PIIN_00145 [Serendipita indica DSM 11827]|uniref:Protein kinase domain-containing protein n=1 Tax=Serendipita indica (strain DSM 11827) TaxID=1109443 RepID=G4T597_SERID|nr:hypothetical protein PIIN_00145 [Serendipita indica DSM 11827]